MTARTVKRFARSAVGRLVVYVLSTVCYGTSFMLMASGGVAVYWGLRSIVERKPNAAYLEGGEALEALGVGAVLVGFPR